MEENGRWLLSGVLSEMDCTDVEIAMQSKVRYNGFALYSEKVGFAKILALQLVEVDIVKCQRKEVVTRKLARLLM